MHEEAPTMHMMDVCDELIGRMQHDASTSRRTARIAVNVKVCTASFGSFDLFTRMITI